MFETAMRERDALRDHCASLDLQVQLAEQRNQDLLGIRNTLQSKLDAAEGACAEMREALKETIPCLEAMQRIALDWQEAQGYLPGGPLNVAIAKALSSDAGRDYVHNSEVERVWKEAIQIAGATLVGYNSQDGEDLDMREQIIDNMHKARDAKKPAQ